MSFLFVYVHFYVSAIVALLPVQLTNLCSESRELVRLLIFRRLRNAYMIRYERLLSITRRISVVYVSSYLLSTVLYISYSYA